MEVSVQHPPIRKMRHMKIKAMHRKIATATIVAGAMFGLMTSAQAVATMGWLVDQNGQPAGSITVGNLIFSNFTLTYGVTNTTPLMTDVGAAAVTSFSDALATGLQVGATFATPVAGVIYQATWGYTVTAADGYSITGFSGSAMGNAWASSGESTGSSTGSAGMTVTGAGGSLNGSGIWADTWFDSNTFTGEQSLNVVLTTTVTSSPDFDPTSGGSTFDPRQSFTVVPEPGSAALALLGAVGLVARRRRR